MESFGVDGPAWAVALLGGGLSSVVVGIAARLDRPPSDRAETHAAESVGERIASLGEAGRVVADRNRGWPTVVFGAAAVGAAAATNAHPTGTGLVDIVYRCVFAAAVFGLFRIATRVGRLAFVATLALAALVSVWPSSSFPSWLAATFLACGVAVGWIRRMESSATLASAVGAALAVVAQHGSSETNQRFWVRMVAAGLLAGGVLVLGVSGLKGARGKLPRSVIRGLIGACVGVGLAVVAMGFYAIGVGRTLRADLSEGATLASTGIAQAEALDREGSITSFDEARRRLDRVESRLRSPLFRAARFLPIAGQNLAASRSVTQNTKKLVDEALKVLRAADLETLRLPDGSLDLNVLQGLRGDLGRAKSEVSFSLSAVRALDPTWLVPPVRDRLKQLSEKLEKAEPVLKAAEAASANFPQLLGASTPRRYLLLAATPSETRGSGGLIGNWGELTVSNGRLKLERFERIITLIEGGKPWEQRTFSGPREYLERYSEFTPMRHFQNLLVSPDFPANAAMAADQYPQAGGRPVDGVVAIDPFGFAALLALTGPLQVDGLAQPVTEANAAQTLLFDLYKDSAGSERIDMLNQIFQAGFSKLNSIPLSDPARIESVFAKPVKERRIQMWLRDPELEAYVKSIGLSGDYASDDAEVKFGIVNQNAGGNKIDWFLHRSVTYESTIVSGQPVTSTIGVRLRNEAPATGLPDYVIGNVVAAREVPTGTNTTILSLYTSGEVAEVKADGVSVATKLEKEFGLNVYSLLVDIPAGSEKRFTFSVVEKPLGVSKTYRVRALYQPFVNPDSLDIRLATPSDWTVKAKPSPSTSSANGTGSDSNANPDGTTSEDGTFVQSLQLGPNAEWVFAAR